MDWFKPQLSVKNKIRGSNFIISMKESKICKKGILHRVLVYLRFLCLCTKRLNRENFIFSSSVFTSFFKMWKRFMPYSREVWDKKKNRWMCRFFWKSQRVELQLRAGSPRGYTCRRLIGCFIVQMKGSHRSHSFLCSWWWFYDDLIKL